MARSKLDLMKIGQEGFAMLDDYFGPHKGAAGKKKQHPLPPPPPPPGPPQEKYSYEGQPKKPHVYQVIIPAPAASKEAAVVMDCHEAAKLYGGTVIVDHHRYPNASTTTTTNCKYQFQPTQSQVYQVTPIVSATAETVFMDSYHDSDNFHGGSALIKDYPFRKPFNMA